MAAQRSGRARSEYSKLGSGSLAPRSRPLSTIRAEVRGPPAGRRRAADNSRRNETRRTKAQGGDQPECAELQLKTERSSNAATAHEAPAKSAAERVAVRAPLLKVLARTHALRHAHAARTTLHTTKQLALLFP